MADVVGLQSDYADGELDLAIERGELVLHYQPVVDLTSSRMVGAEALVRWQHPRRGLLAPAEFIPEAERTGAILALGAWVLGAACQQASEWQAARPVDPPLIVSVNVSAHQLDEPTFVETVTSALDAAALAPAALCLEVTETAVMANPANAAAAVQSLRDLGVGTAIDDFGIGYASLTYLRQLNVSTVKIDRSFTSGLGQGEYDTMIVAAVVGLCHAMGLSVTAEGVETSEQLEVLQSMGCQCAQGYLMCRPVPAHQLTDQLERQWLDMPTAGPRLGPPAPGEVVPLVPDTAATPPSRHLRVLVIADDSDADHDTLRRSIEANGQYEVIAQAADCEAAVPIAAAHQPDLVLLDSKMTKLNEMAALPKILLAAPDTRVALLADHATVLSIGALPGPFIRPRTDGGTTLRS